MKQKNIVPCEVIRPFVSFGIQEVEFGIRGVVRIWNPGSGTRNPGSGIQAVVSWNPGSGSGICGIRNPGSGIRGVVSGIQGAEPGI